MTAAAGNSRLAGSMLQAYVAVLHQKDTSALESLTDGVVALFEIPFLRPNRLVGRHEILAAHAAMFSTIDRFFLELAPPLHGDRFAMTQGSLNIIRQSGETLKHEVGIVAECNVHHLTRLSLYADARNIRPWSDVAIL